MEDAILSLPPDLKATLRIVEDPDLDDELRTLAAGALIRHSFVARHAAHVQGRRAPWEHAVAGVALLLGLAIWLAPAARPVAAAAAPATWSAVQAVVNQRCVLCHGEQVQNKNVALHTPALVQQHALAVYQQAAVLKLMPMNNATQITEDERDLIKRWYEAGAKVE